jgi:hypothetical protein
MTDKVYEGLWDCSNCGMTGIPGSVKVCPRPGCGDPQNSVLTPEEDWYLPENAREVTDSAELDLFDDGEDWNCGKCGTNNNGATTECSRCGEALGFNDTVNREVVYDDRAGNFDAEPDPVDEMIESDLDRAERAITTEASKPRKMKDLTLPGSELPRIGKDTKFYDDIREGVEQKHDESLKSNDMASIMKKIQPHKGKIIIGVGVVLLLVIAFIGVSCVRHFTATTAGTVTVSELHWQRTVEVEEYRTLNDGGWSYPSDARVQSDERRIHHYDTVHDRWDTQRYTDYETRYKTESYTDREPRTRSESYSGTCTRMVSGGNGSYRSESYSCTQYRTVTDYVTVQKTRQVPYQVPVERTRQVEITHQEARWATWYNYQVDRWVTDRWVNASDSTSDEAIWPEVTDLDRNTVPGDQVGEERVGNERKENYEIVYTDSKGTKHSEGKGYDVWSKLEPGETLPARYYERNGELDEGSVDWNSVLAPAA